MSKKEEFPKWFTKRCEELGLTDEQAAEHLDCTESLVVGIKHGKVAWAQLPPDIKRKIEQLLGKYPVADSSEQESLIPKRSSEDIAYRQFGAPAPAPDWDDVLEGIQKELEALEDELEPPEPEQLQEEDDPELLGSEQSLLASDFAIDYFCRCTAPVLIKDKGRCSKCERLGDGSQ